MIKNHFFSAICCIIICKLQKVVSNMSKRYYACVYGGASERIADVHIKEIEKLGKIIVQNGFSLVYGAGGTGCMGAAARGVHRAGGYVMGISPGFMGDFEDIYECDNTVIVDTMAERKTLMEKHADIYFIAPGGVGTMDEFFQVVTLKYLKRFDTPIVILNIDGFYDALLALIDSLIDSGAVQKSIYELFDVATKCDDEVVVKLLKDIKSN